MKDKAQLKLVAPGSYDPSRSLKSDVNRQQPERASTEVDSTPDLVSEKWLTTRHASQYMKCSEGEIRNKVWRGELPFYKPFGRLLFKRADLDRLIETSRKGGWK